MLNYECRGLLDFFQIFFANEDTFKINNCKTSDKVICGIAGEL